MNSKSIIEKEVQENQYIDIRNICSINGSAKFDPNTNITTLTEAINSQAGAIAGKTALDMRRDFTLVADIYLGSKSNGADGIAIAFHRGAIGFVGTIGGGLGILGAPNGIGFEIDTYWNTEADEKGDAFGHGQMNGPHAGFVSTDRNRNYLTALAPMQNIPAPNGKWRTLTINWDARNNILTAWLQEKNNDDPTRSTTPRYQTWELMNPTFDLSQKYTFVIGSATGAANNKHQIGISKFDAHFTKPTIVAHDVDIKIGTAFDPLNYEPIGLKATDEVDGDITDKIKYTSNVDTSKPGKYQVIYTVENSFGESDTKPITVTVPVMDDGWEDGEPKGWKFFSGETITLKEDEENALNGKWVFYADKHVAIYKQVEFKNNTPYQISVYVKPEDEEAVAHHIVKVSFKSDSAGQESEEILNERLIDAEQIQKGYRKLTSIPFTPTTIVPNKKPVIIVENFLPGWIGGVRIIVEPTK
ncbi:lectin-like domain-containing protein [Bacillus bingmayongensis]|uniref:lectin-like domain-containing protein n=1 Tax=Bacillus bingmayongensis TaxID=1150157 RepID=UPI00031B39BC|nr:immunoglobulin-like domain-containing protein [Bacillus bingmayongensis]